MYLGLPLEIKDVGLGELEERLAELVEADAGTGLGVPSGHSGTSPEGERGDPRG